MWEIICYAIWVVFVKRTGRSMSIYAMVLSFCSMVAPLSGGFAIFMVQTMCSDVKCLFLIWVMFAEKIRWICAEIHDFALLWHHKERDLCAQGHEFSSSCGFEWCLEKSGESMFLCYCTTMTQRIYDFFGSHYAQGPGIYYPLDRLSTWSLGDPQGLGPDTCPVNKPLGRKNRE